MNILRVIIKILSFILAVPFVTYGFLGLIKTLSLEGPIDKYLGLVGNYHNPVTALILVVIGGCLIYGLNALANKIR
ncbi:hypothetical protein [Desulfovibrio ferrophilus]|uniref:Alkaline phosphatase n=1 Tax=Desulfovibrio ferrophilus TaxID=241368 RepID=A0A2Z6AZG5_9BACT|nr:hypothetical protein [Desulfovibrio ferrophilus]BBD08661.1 alkaline phosphatase [Desulfovibrio ferrophilus]